MTKSASAVSKLVPRVPGHTWIELVPVDTGNVTFKK